MAESEISVDQTITVHGDGNGLVTLQMKVSDDTQWGFECWFSELNGEELIGLIAEALAEASDDE